MLFWRLLNEVISHLPEIQLLRCVGANSCKSCSEIFTEKKKTDIPIVIQVLLGPKYLHKQIFL